MLFVLNRLHLYDVSIKVMLYVVRLGTDQQTTNSVCVHVLYIKYDMHDHEVADARHTLA